MESKYHRTSISLLCSRMMQVIYWLSSIQEYANIKNNGEYDDNAIDNCFTLLGPRHFEWTRIFGQSNL